MRVYSMMGGGAGDGVGGEVEVAVPWAQNMGFWISGRFYETRRYRSKAECSPPRHVQFFSSPTELMQRYPLMRPKVILAVPPSLSHGPSRWLFTVMAGTEGNVILLTGIGEDDTLSREVYDSWAAGQDAAALWGRGRVGHLQDLAGEKRLEVSSNFSWHVGRLTASATQMESKVPLAGAELDAHLEAERAQKEKEAAHQAAVDRSRRMLEADDLDTDSESGSEAGDEQPGGILISRAEPESDDKLQMSFDIFVKGQQMRVGRGTKPGKWPDSGCFRIWRGRRGRLTNTEKVLMWACGSGEEKRSKRRARPKQ